MISILDRASADASLGFAPAIVDRSGDPSPRVSTFLSIDRYGNIYHGQRSMFALAIAFSVVSRSSPSGAKHVESASARAEGAALDSL